jgi:hypothetical protein
LWDSIVLPTASLPQPRHCPMRIYTSLVRSHEIRQILFNSVFRVTTALSIDFLRLSAFGALDGHFCSHSHNSFCVFVRLVGFVSGNHSFCRTADQSNGFRCDLGFDILIKFLIDNHHLPLFGIRVAGNTALQRS